MKQEMTATKKSLVCIFVAILLSVCLATVAYGATSSYRTVGATRGTAYPMGGNLNYGANTGLQSCFSNYHNPSKSHYSQASSISNGTTQYSSTMGAGSWSYATLYGSFNTGTVFYYFAHTV